MGVLLDSFAPTEFEAILRFLDGAASVLSRSHSQLVMNDAAEPIGPPAAAP